MRTSLQKSDRAQPATSTKSSTLTRAGVEQGHNPKSILDLQRTIGNQRPSRLLRSNIADGDAVSAMPAFADLGHHFARIPVSPLQAGALQTKLAVNTQGDEYERQAERVAEQVMRTSEPSVQRTCLCGGVCSKCEEEETLRRKAAPALKGGDSWEPWRAPEAKVNAVRGGQPLTNEQKAFFEPRLGVDFSTVRVHTDSSADAAARAVGAYAYTRGSDIVFREGQYSPDTYAGRQLLAHELTHVIQQGAARPRPVRPVNERTERRVLTNELQTSVASHLVQRAMCDPPQPFIRFPGDCSWARYIVLRASVQTAKVIVDNLGGCARGDNCPLLAAKIAAIGAELAARVTMMATCFRGGDEGHCEQVRQKIVALNRCYEHFDRSSPPCPQQLIAAMAVVVEQVRAVMAAATVALAIAVVVALVAALIALWEVIAALAAAAAAAGLEGIAAAVLALLRLLIGQLATE